MNQVRLKNAIGRISLVGQIVKLAPNSTTSYILANTPDPEAIGTVAESVPSGYRGLVNLLNTVSWDDISDAPIFSFNTDGIDNKADEIINILKEGQECLNEKICANPEEIMMLNMDRAQNMPFQVQLPKDLKQEPDGGLVLADMKGPYYWTSATASTPITIDCTGYQSVLVQKTTTGVVTPTISNNRSDYVATVAIAASTTIPAATILTAAGIYVLPVVSKFLRLTGPASTVQCYIYLSRTPAIPLLNTATNLAQVAGTATVTAGVNGMIAVGGNIASGTAPTANPVQIGGVDDLKTPLTRRILTDSLGRTIISTQTGQVAGTASTLSSPINELGFLSTYKNVLSVQELGRGDDACSELDLLYQILIELKILNQQMYELPRLIDEGNAAEDAPEDFRKDPTNTFK